MAAVIYNPFATERHELFTRLTPEQCVRRLKDSMNTFQSLQLFFSLEPRHDGPVYGWVSRRGFTLRKTLSHVQDLYSSQISSSPCQAVASGRFFPEANGTRIVVSLAMSRFAAVFLTLCVVGLLLFTLAFAIASFTSPVAIIGLLTCVAMLALLGVLYAYLCQLAGGARGGESESQFLLQFLLRTLSAEEVVRHKR